MTDIENEIFDACANAVSERYPNITATSSALNAPAEFPAVSIIETNNYTDDRRTDSSGVEKGSVITYDVKAYSGLRTGAKAQAKAIASIVDDFMVSHNFKRTFRSQGEMPGGQSVYVVTSRYMAGVTEDKKLYRR